MNQLIVSKRPSNGVVPILPSSIDEIWRMARMAVVGKMAPASLVDKKDPDEATSACAIAIMAGAELGLTPLMSLRSYAVINGRPALWGDGLKAVVRQSGRCEYIRTGSDQTKGWCEAKRSDTGEEKRVEFTMQQAKAARLDTKTGPWNSGYADVMMERRATNRCLNDLFADVLGGIVDAQEAIDDGPMEEQQLVVAPPPPEEAMTIEADDAPEPEPTFDAEVFLADLFVSLSTGETEEAVMELWDEHDVEATLTNDEDALQKAFDIRKDRLLAIVVPFPGDQ